jgi:hypothetical protein
MNRGPQKRITEGIKEPPQMVEKRGNWWDNAFLLKIDRLRNIEHLRLCETREIKQTALIKNSPKEFFSLPLSNVNQFRISTRG